MDTDVDITEWISSGLGLNLSVELDPNYTSTLDDLSILLLTLQRIYAKALSRADIVGFRVNFDYSNAEGNKRQLVMNIKNEAAVEKQKLKALIDDKIKVVAETTKLHNLKSIGLNSGLNKSGDPIVVINVTLE